MGSALHREVVKQSLSCQTLWGNGGVSLPCWRSRRGWGQQRGEEEPGCLQNSYPSPRQVRGAGRRGTHSGVITPLPPAAHFLSYLEQRLHILIDKARLHGKEGAHHPGTSTSAHDRVKHLWVASKGCSTMDGVEGRSYISLGLGRPFIHKLETFKTFISTQASLNF